MLMLQFPRRTALSLALAFALSTSPVLAAPALPDFICEINNISQTTVNGEPRLRFGTWAVNLGSGPMEVHAVDQSNGTRKLYQRVYDPSTPTGFTDTKLGEFQVGNDGFVRMPDAADFFLREVMDDDSVGGLLSANQKVGYCFVDSQRYPSSSPPGTPNSGVYGWTIPACGDVLGTSVGWVDNYGPSLPNQYVVLTGVSSGTYWLENILDPLNRLAEANDANNSARVKVTITTPYSPEIALLGNGVVIPNNDSTPTAADHTDIGYVEPGGSLTRTFTIQNSGSGSLSLTGLPKVKVIGSTDFSVASLPVSPVNAGGTTSFQVTYQPTALNGAAEIVIANNDADEGPYRFALRGNTDADGDGMPDGWETLHNVSDATADEDGDGASNRDEFIAGTSPRDALSVFKIINTQRNGSSIEVTWTSAVSRTYKLYSRPSLPAANGDAAGWELVGEFAGTSGPITGSLPIAGSASRFFRVTTGF